MNTERPSPGFLPGYFFGVFVCACLGVAANFWWEDQPAEWRAEKIASVQQWSNNVSMSTNASCFDRVYLTDGEMKYGRVQRSHYGETFFLTADDGTQFDIPANSVHSVVYCKKGLW